MLTYYNYVTLNKEAIGKSTECACIYCFKRMKPDEITDYCLDINSQGIEVNETAICPYCNIDSIIPNSLVQYTETDLKNWHKEGWN